MAPRKNAKLSEVAQSHVDDDSMDVDEDVSTWPQVKLKTSDGKRFTLTRAEASCSNALRTMIESFLNGPNGQSIPLLPDYISLRSINSQVFTRILEWCQKHSNDQSNRQKASNFTYEPTATRSITQRNPQVEWEKGFMDGMSEEDLLRLIHAANYLDITSLLNALCQKMAKRWEGSKVEDIRKMYNIANDLPPEEEHQMLLDNKKIGFDG